jgi:hypothetical protein
MSSPQITRMFGFFLAMSNSLLIVALINLVCLYVRIGGLKENDDGAEYSYNQHQYSHYLAEWCGFDTTVARFCEPPSNSYVLDQGAQESQYGDRDKCHANKLQAVKGVDLDSLGLQDVARLTDGHAEADHGYRRTKPGDERAIGRP